VLAAAPKKDCCCMALAEAAASREREIAALRKVCSVCADTAVMPEIACSGVCC